MLYFWIIWIGSIVSAIIGQLVQITVLKRRMSVYKLLYPGKKVPSWDTVFLLTILKQSLFLGGAAWIGLRLSPEVGLHMYLLDSAWKGQEAVPFSWVVFIGMSCFMGIIVSGCLWLLDWSVLLERMPKQQNSTFTKKRTEWFAAFYGGVVEEVIFRLGLMTLFVAIFKTRYGLSYVSYWLAIFLWQYCLRLLIYRLTCNCLVEKESCSLDACYLIY